MGDIMASITFILNRRGWQLTDWIKAKNISSVVELQAAIKMLGAEQVDKKTAKTFLNEASFGLSSPQQQPQSIESPKKKSKKKKEVAAGFEEIQTIDVEVGLSIKSTI